MINRIHILAIVDRMYTIGVKWHGEDGVPFSVTPTFVEIVDKIVLSKF